ncbi:MAG: aryl-sulfate sulfotransferase [Desulfobacula sp.]|nr:aryl-sulfate sulfotransferase [Desulfobacula sp.]
MRLDKKLYYLIIFIFVITLVDVPSVFAARAVTYSPPKPEPDFVVDVYLPEKAWNGTTILADNHIRNRPRIIEIDMKGNIIWEYVIPANLKKYNNPGFDIEPLPNNNILFVLPGKGIYEIDRKGKTIWSHPDKKISHDADRLANGNTLYVYGKDDKKSNAQVKEVNKKGKLVWSWHAKTYFNKPPYADHYNEGWSHTNAVVRLKNGNTLISPRNFNCLVEITSQGDVVKTIGNQYLVHPHDPQILDNGNILVANHDKPHEILEINPGSQKIVWRFPLPRRKVWPVRDANQLPNGNILITGSTALVEITKDKEIVWRLKFAKIAFKARQDAPALGFYKAERIRP